MKGQERELHSRAHLGQLMFEFLIAGLQRLQVVDRHDDFLARHQAVQGGLQRLAP